MMFCLKCGSEKVCEPNTTWKDRGFKYQYRCKKNREHISYGLWSFKEEQDLHPAFVPVRTIASNGYQTSWVPQELKEIAKDKNYHAINLYSAFLKYEPKH